MTKDASGRLTSTIGLRTQRLVYGELTPVALRDELSLTTEIDLAHVVMLAEQDLLERPAAARLLRSITALRDEDYTPLRELPAPRGVYLMYERYLSQTLGEEIGGRLHTGRSRNDLKATATAMRLRFWALDFLAEAVRLEAVLLSRARAHQDVVMPVHTHFQAAMPITYGHYLTGVALALGRDITAVQQAADGLSMCPLGAGAVAGSDLPIAPARVADLLGFDRPNPHALDAVASRDVLLRLLGAVSGIGITLSRLATDLQLWSTVEFGFVLFPDRLVGGSSAMPQKRNAFLLEHVKAKAGLAVGAWTAMASAMKSAPFTNTIEVGTEAVGAAWPGLHAVTDSVLLCQALVSGARPVPDRMEQRAADGFVTATTVANRLVRHGVPFRSAHHLVGDAVRQAVERGSTRLEDLELPPGTPEEAARDLPLHQAVAALEYGGGPGAFAFSFTEARAAMTGHSAWCRRLRDRQRDAAAALDETVRRVMGAEEPMTDRTAETVSPWLALVESNTTGTGRRFCAAARDRGMRPVMLTRRPERYPYLTQDGIDVVVLDTTDGAVVLAACRELADGAGLAGVTSSSEYFIATAAATADALGLPAPDAEAVERCRDKARQRTVLAEAGVAVPRFAEVKDAASASRAATEMGLPVVVKPVAGSGSIGVLLCETAENAGRWADRLLTGPDSDGHGRVLVEEYVTGPEYSVETFDDRVVTVVGKHLGAVPHFVETGHDVPARADEREQARLGETTLRALAALRLGWGPAHTELRLSRRGPVVIEVNPRLAGGMIPVAIERATGTDLVDATIARVCGQPAPETGSGAGHGAIRFLVAPHGGTVAALADPEPARSVPGIVTADYIVAAGDTVTISHSFRDRLGYAIGTGPDAETAERVAGQALALMDTEITETAVGPREAVRQ
ncbi:argininosuccinate lyase [Streptomyces sp. NPDC102451]|uniref:argininosuccinate lyase n=1 Tax=Streptomyces sp. NPDC102451 TaxID=3366177 RepID=UPI0037F9CE0F